MVIRDIKDLASKFFFKNSPFYVQFQITDKCNLQCRFCNVPDNLKQYDGLNLQEIEKIIFNLGKIKTTTLILTGGEPFFRKDLHEIIRLAKEHIPYVRLQSNGLLINETNLGKCIAAGLDGITISCDSLDPEIQDFINAQKSSFSKLIDKIVLVNNLFPANKGPLALNATVSHLNYEGIKKLVEFADEINWLISLVPVHIGTELKDFTLRKNDDGQTLDKKAIDTLCDELMTLKKNGSNISNSKTYIKNINFFLTSNTTNWRHPYKGKFVCDSPNLYFGIRPNGEFTICHDFPFSKKIFVQDASFAKQYKQNLFQEVKDEAMNCHGCYYGCYPEYTWVFNKAVHFTETIFTHAKNILKEKRRHIDKEELLKKIA